MIGTQILNYKIKSLIGDGGMGTVYLAEHDKLGRRVAIKVLHKHLASNESIRQRFVNEAKTMAELQHPNIVAMLDYHEDAFGLYLIMEFVEGMPLDEYIKTTTGPIPEERAKQIFRQALAAFSYAHSKGFVHRDIKPSNLMIGGDGILKVLDFGIAKLVGDANYKLTKTGAHTGTVYYMSPEQVKGLDVDKRSDIYSLGITLFQMLTGHNPYGDLTTEYEIFENIVKVPLADPRLIYPAVSSHMCSVISKATEKEPGARFGDCDAFAAALDKPFEYEGSVERLNEESKRASNTTNTQLPQTNSQASKQKPPLPKVLLFLVPLFLIGAGLGIWWIQKPKKTDSIAVQAPPSDDLPGPVNQDEKAVTPPLPEPSDSPAIKKAEVETRPAADSVKVKPLLTDLNAPLLLTVSAPNITALREKLKARSNALMKGKNYRPKNCTFNPATFTFRCTLVPDATSFTKISLVYSPVNEPCLACDNAVLKNPGSQVLVDVSDSKFHYNIISIAE
jgi:serine/threonine protein kinase